MVTGIETSGEQVVHLFDQLVGAKDSFKLIWTLVSILILVIGVTTGVLVIVWLE